MRVQVERRFSARGGAGEGVEPQAGGGGGAEAARRRHQGMRLQRGVSEARG